jgi:hypothetical protein
VPTTTTCGPGTHENAASCLPEIAPTTVTLSAETIDFGLVDCATMAHPRGITITNRGAASIAFTSVLSRGVASPYALYPSSGTVTPNSSLALVVAPAPIPSFSAVTPNLYDDTLTITTTGAGDVPHVVALRETAHGAILTSSVLAFGSRLIGDLTPMASSWTNAGNADARLVLSTAAPFSLASASLEVGANGLPVTDPVTFTPDSFLLGIPTSRRITAVTATPLCAPIPNPSLLGTSIEHAATVSTGYDSTCALGTSGITYCWGSNILGQLGDDAPSPSVTPRPVVGVTGVASLVSEYRTTCAVKTNGTVMCWGYNVRARGSNPVVVPFATDAKGIGVGGDFQCILHAGGTANTYGQLGNGSFAYSRCPWTSRESRTPSRSSRMTPRPASSARRGKSRVGATTRAGSSAMERPPLPGSRSMFST